MVVSVFPFHDVVHFARRGRRGAALTQHVDQHRRTQLIETVWFVIWQFCTEMNIRSPCNPLAKTEPDSRSRWSLSFIFFLAEFPPYLACSRVRVFSAHGISFL
nr:uncharacterized protein CTRU02_02313 [Colletotrichum truncatum]KAF6798340.1 hypothetical protein CTRU02_02313 [Colletotrichum truncatum]